MKWQPTPVLLLGESHEQGACQVTVHGVKRVRHDVAIKFNSVQFSRSVISDHLRPHELQHARTPCPSPAPGVHPNPCPSCQCCHPTISSSVAPFSSCCQSFPAPGSFPVSWLFPSGGQSIGASTSASVLPMKIHSRFPLGLISLWSKGL